MLYLTSNKTTIRYAPNEWEMEDMQLMAIFIHYNGVRNDLIRVFYKGTIDGFGHKVSKCVGY